MKNIYVCSPYRGEVEKNVKYGQAICRELVLKGDFPIAPHLYLTQFLDDNNETERELAFTINFKLLDQCDHLLVCGKKISSGMKAEIEYCEKINKEVRYYDN